MPELGINAIYLAADALGTSLSPGAPHPLMKQPTLNVGRIEGGLNINSVPDRAAFDGYPQRAQPATRGDSPAAGDLGEQCAHQHAGRSAGGAEPERHQWIQSVYRACAKP